MAVSNRRSAARGAIRAYQLTLSALAGSQCRHLPTCSAYMDEAIARHGLWAGGFMGVARVCRCQPFGTAGFDPVPLEPAAEGRAGGGRGAMGASRRRRDGIGASDGAALIAGFPTAAARQA